MDEIKLLDASDTALLTLRRSGWIIKSPYFTATGEPVFIAVRPLNGAPQRVIATLR